MCFYYQFLIAIFIVAGLSSCNNMENSATQSSDYEPYVYNTYYQADNTLVDYSRPMSEQEVKIPDSYYVGGYHSPMSHKDSDKSWVKNQSPQAYTIEVADGEKASQVAAKLYKIPKKDRMAEIKYQANNGKASYKGLYGSYSSYEEAQKAFATLPEEVKQGAGIKSWSNIQSTINP